ncbi:nucleotidyltransferase family protein [Dyella sp. A6]|uniref:nucleotidyltransferase family protein n=1 Tax=Dyella aluminiiresistens TaxID=3069105 RepID=UPI002E765FAA|nr:nucleotidyltransferase family protein [Dyella sp. A6]
METPAGTPAIVLLAAGEGRRFGGAKQLADFDGEPMVRRVARDLLALDCPLVAVIGARAERVAPVLQDLPLVIIRNDNWQNGLGSSIACGVRHVGQAHAHASGVLLCLADQPMVGGDHLRRMLARHRDVPDCLLVTCHEDVSGPPVLFPRDCMPELADLDGPVGARTLIQREAARVERFHLAEHPDVDTPADLDRLRALLAPGSTDQ